MKKFIIYILISLGYIACEPKNTNTPSENSNQTIPADYALVIHGGAGTITRNNMTPEKERQYLDALHKALDVGEGILKNGGSSMDAVVQTIKILENNPLFNAGKGAVFTHDETNSLDASIMRGSDLNAGAVAGVSTVKNPIMAARAVMENSEHVMLSGTGADEFSNQQGLEIVDSKYFYTEKRYDALRRIKEKDLGFRVVDEDYKFGTVGAVALDENGDIVAGTSTGGMTNKKYGRIGDSPVIGAGTYANNATCGVSCTGHGEYFIRWAVAHDISAILEYTDLSVTEAGEKVIMDKLVKVDGSGGAIILDKFGNVAMPFNSEGMYRGYVKPGERVVKIYKE